MIKSAKRIIKYIFSRDKDSIKYITRITGEAPDNVSIYQLSLRHSSLQNSNENILPDDNERLEFLGDAVLDAVIAEYLFRKFPTKDEGFLTETKAKIVSRENLSELARKIGLDKLIQFDPQSKNSGLKYKYIYGDAIEAFIGAVFLDKGFDKTKKFILNKLISPFIDLEKLISTSKNFKSKLLEWVQKEGKKIEYKVLSESLNGSIKTFHVQVLIDSNGLGEGKFYNKKQAEQNAAEQACNSLGI